MTRRFVPVRRIAALSVTISLLNVPIASAQSPDAAPSIAAPTNTTLLNPAAFARLLQPPPDVAPVPVVKIPPRLDLLRSPTTAMAREANAAFTKAPQEKSWASRHKTITGIVVGAGAFLGVMAFCTLAVYCWGE